MVGAPSKGDLVEIVNECYPSLVTFSVKLIGKLPGMHKSIFSITNYQIYMRQFYLQKPLKELILFLLIYLVGLRQLVSSVGSC